jgi:Na+-translocating ferredoxin:NAD+ oxidoreductase RnfG subunit
MDIILTLILILFFALGFYKLLGAVESYTEQRIKRAEYETKVLEMLAQIIEYEKGLM